MKDVNNPLGSDPRPFAPGQVVLILDAVRVHEDDKPATWGKFQVIAAGTRYIRLRGVPDSTPLGLQPLQPECPDEACIECGRQKAIA